MPERIRLQRTKGWRMPAGAVSVARPTRWGNVYVVGEGEVAVTGRSVGPGAGFYDPSDERSIDLPLKRGLSDVECVQLYRDDLIESLADPDEYYDELRRAVDGLRGRDLGCWCGLSAPCHGDPLLELANLQTPWIVE